ncbi:MAG: histidinol-phosphate transaminase [Solirubrobacterales bacterium]
MIRSALDEVEPYRPGLGIAEVKARFLGLERLVKLGSNELAMEPLEAAVEAAVRALSSSSRYPDPWATEIREALAERHHVDPDQVVFGNGADELIRLLAQATLEPGDGCAFPWPGFPTYRQAALVAGARVEAIATPPDDAGVAGLRASIGPQTRLVCFANPNNPTGAHAGHDEIVALAEGLQGTAILLLDEAYCGFVDPEAAVDGTDLVAEGRSNVCVLRTFSKAYGLAGLRVGYAVTAPRIARALEQVRTMFNVNVAGQAAALAAMGVQDEVDRRTEAVRERRVRLMSILFRGGLKVYPSQGNFVFCQARDELVDARVRRAEQIADALLERGVIVRRMDGFGASDGIRVTVGSDSELDFLEQALSALAADSDLLAAPQRGGGV